MRHPHLPTIALAALLASAASCQSMRDGIALFHAAPNPRQVLNFDKDWKFHLGDAQDAAAMGYADAPWRTLNVPHDYAIEGPAVRTPAMEGPFDPQSPAKHDGGFLDAGVAWYRKTFTLPATAKGHQVAIQFDGVYMNSDVYLNGKLLGNHPYGYTSFQYDLTPALNFDGPNTLAVRVNVEQPCSRWYSGAGIYRHVYLNITNPVHIAPWGIYVTTPKISDTEATLDIRATVQNDSGAAVAAIVKSRIFDPNGKEIASLGVTDNLAANASSEVQPRVTIPHPQLWSVDQPSLYKVVSEVSVDGEIVDSVTTPVGIRTIEFTKDNGFLLNGRRVQIHGVCDHHDLGALGSAFNYRALQRQLEVLKSFGCNAIRTSHNPPATELLDLADEMGFVVMDEPFDEWKRSKTKFGYGRFFDEWSERDIVSMLHRDRNHPSIVLWSIGNEIPEQGASNGGAMAKRLADIVRREDPTRFVTSACNNPAPAAKSGFADALDVFGINYNIPAYTAQKGHVLIASETASALSTRGEYGLIINKKGDVEIQKQIRTISQCTSYDNLGPRWGYTAEAQLIGLKNAPWVAGEFVWTGFDYIGEPTPYQWPSRSSYFGIVDLAGFPKDRFYIYQSQWTTKPMVHLLPHWNWPGFEGKAIPVQAYTNADSVELFLNGQSLGSRDFTNNKTLHLEWKVPYAPGTLKAVATKNGHVVATDEVVTAGPPAKIELVADRPSIHADGSDLSFITVKVVDKDGHVCPNADNEMSFSLNGPAVIAGLDNGDPTNHESFQGTSHKIFHGLGLVILRSQESAGKATVTAETQGLEAVALPIELVK